jgi:hypothetical protein
MAFSGRAAASALLVLIRHFATFGRDSCCHCRVKGKCFLHKQPAVLQQGTAEWLMSFISSAVSDVTELTSLAFATWNLLQVVPALWNLLRTKQTGLCIIIPHYVFVNHSYQYVR